MRRRTIAALIATVAAAGCAKSTVSTVPTPSPTPSGNYTAQATDWWLRSIGSDGRTISIVYGMSGVASGCTRRGTTTADESAEKVVVTAHRLVLQDPRPCTEEFAYVDAVVMLNSPIGSRALVGCRPGRTDASEDRVCRDPSRSRDLPTPQPTPTD